MLCIGLEEALRLSTEFSVLSADGDVPDGLLVPIPAAEHCRFVAKPWREIDQAERESFRRFYAAVGGELEELAANARRGLDLDEVIWADITAALTRA